MSGKRRADREEVLLDDPRVGELIGADRWQQLRDDVELLGAGREFDMDEVRRGRLSPVFFGSALTNFGVEPFLEAFLQHDAAAPVAHGRLRRDRRLQPGLLRLRLQNSGKYEQGPPRPPRLPAHLLRQVRARGRGASMCRAASKLRLSQPQQLMAQEREIIDEAYAGDIIGVFDPGIFSIGDTITAPGKKFRFAGIPTFAPEHFSRVSPKDTMKRKQFVKGTEQIAQEGAIQIFKVPDTGMEEVIVGVVGTLQFDVFQLPYAQRVRRGAAHGGPAL